MKKTFIRSILFLLVTVYLIACTKVEKGPKGDPGAPGRTPNVQTQLVTIYPNMWDSTATYRKVSIAVPAITQEILDHGTVQMYVLKNNVWFALPFLEEDLFTIFGYETGKINLTLGDSHHLLPEQPGTDQYKIVTMITL